MVVPSLAVRVLLLILHSWLELCSAVAGDGTTSKTMQFVADNGNISIIPESCGANEMRTMCRMHLMLSGLSEYWDEVEDDDGSD